MMNLELPHINKVLSKIDLLKEYGDLHLRLSHYFDCTDLSFITNNSSNPEKMNNFEKKYFKLN